MSETTCPICHSRVEVHMSDWNFSYKPLSSHDLTKLREAFCGWVTWFDSNPQSKTERQLIEAVKELLENK